MQLSDLRKELQFTKELVQLIETLKNIAAAQFHMIEKEKERFELFMESFSGFFRVVNLVRVDNPLVRVMSDVTGVLVVTSDSGFMGGLNQGVMRKAFEIQGDQPAEKIAYMVIGEKGAGTFSDQGRPFKAFPGVVHDKIYEQATVVRDYLVKEVLEGRMGKVVLAYPRPLPFSAQEIKTINLLPCAELFDISKDKEEVPAVKDKQWITDARKVVIESTFEDMVEYLAGTWITSKLCEVFEDSELAELSARAMHLEGSYQKIEKDLKKVKHLCFKASHELIDKGMRESFAAKGGKGKRAKRKRRADAEAKKDEAKRTEAGSQQAA